MKRGSVVAKASEQTSVDIKTRISLAVFETLKGDIGETVVINDDASVLNEFLEGHLDHQGRTLLADTQNC